MAWASAASWLPTDAVDGTAQHVNGLIGSKLATYPPDLNDKRQVHE